MSQKPLTLGERYNLKACFAKNMSVKASAKFINRSIGVVYKELNRFGLSAQTSACYPTKFDEFLQSSIKHRVRCKRISQITWCEVEKRLISGLSPEAISGRMRNHELEKFPDAPSVTAIYKHIERDLILGKTLLYEKLMFKKPRKIKHKKPSSTGPIKDATTIHERPEKAAKREELGHWEGDLMHIGSGYILLLNEMLTGLKRMTFLSSKCSIECSRAIVKLLRSHKSKIRSITFDRGGEFSRHKEISVKLGCSIFFCDPHAPWQKGAVEQGNWQLRKWFPKKKYCQIPSKKLIRRIEFKLNNTPRKVLYFNTANEVYLSLENEFLFTA